MDHITGTEDSTYADYYNEYDDGAGYTSVVYANADWTEYHGESTYQTEAGYVYYIFDSEKDLE